MDPQALVYGFYDLQLTEPLKFATGDLIGNRDMLYYVEPECGLRFYKLSLHDRVEFEVMRLFPLMMDRSAIWAKVELLRRKIAQMGIPSEQVNRFGRAGDFTLLEANDTAEFVRKCESGTQGDFIAPVRELIRQASEAGIQVIFVEMPMHPAHLRFFYDTLAWEQYRSHLCALLAAQRVMYIDASRRMTGEERFADRLHQLKRAPRNFVKGSERCSDSSCPRPGCSFPGPATLTASDFTSDAGTVNSRQAVQSVATPGTCRIPAKTMPIRPRYRALQSTARRFRIFTAVSSRRSMLSANSDTEPIAKATPNSTQSR
jgi:hypothetical protein